MATALSYLSDRVRAPERQPSRPWILRRLQEPAATYADWSRTPLEAGEAVARHILAKSWGWS